MNKIKQLLADKNVWGIITSVIIMAMVSFLFFFPDDVEGNILSQSDVRQGIANGQETKAYYEATGHVSRWTNSLFGGMPTFQISPSYESNNLIKWIDSAMGLGLPEPANLVMMMMLGFFILMLAMPTRWYVALLGAVAYGLSSYFIILIGAGHIWKFVTLAYVPPTIAGVVLCYRGRYLAGGALAALFAMLQLQSNHVQMTYYFMFVIAGFAIAYLVTAIREKKLTQWLASTGVLAAAALLAAAANSPSLYNTYKYSKETIRGGHSELAEASATSTDGGLDRDYITHYSYEPSETFTFLIPNVKGGATNKPEKGAGRYMSLGDLPAAKKLQSDGKIHPQEAQYLSWMSQYFGGPEGTNGPVYMGALIVALFLLGCVVVKGPLKWALLALTVFSVLLAWGRNCMWLTNLMIDYVPMYSKFRTVESILVIAEFTMPLLAALAVQQLLDKPAAETWAKYRKPIVWCFGVVMAVCAAGVVMPGLFGANVTEGDRQMAAQISDNLRQQLGGGNSAEAQQVLAVLSLDNPRIYSAIESLRQGMVRADSMRSLAFVALGFVMLLLYFRHRIDVKWAAGLVVVLTLADLFFVNKRYLDHESFTNAPLIATTPFPETQTDRVILQDTTKSYRVLSLPHFDSPVTSFRHKSIGGYHAAKLTRYQDLIDHQLRPFIYGDLRTGSWNTVNMLNARYIIDYNGQPMLNDEALGNAWFVDSIVYVATPRDEMALLDSIDVARTAVADKKFESILGEALATSPGDTIFLTSYAPDRLTYHATTAKGGVAVMSEVFFPWGWHADIDGTAAEVGRVDYVLRALHVPAGSHTITMTFDPQSIHTTTTVAYIAIVLIFLAVIASIVLWAVRTGKEENENGGN